MRILIDMDDTIELLLEAWVRKANALYGRDVKCEDVKEWDVTKAYPGLTHEEVYGVLKDPDFWYTVEPAPGAVKGVKKLMEEHDVYIVTVTPYDEIAPKMENLIFRRFPYITWDRVIITGNKRLISADVMIDDGPHNLIGAACEKILVDAPYNREFDEKAYGMTRVRTWDEILDAIERIKHARG